MMNIDARMIVATGFPPDEGKKLAQHVLKECPELQDLEINVSRCPAALLIAAFFSSFLLEIHDNRPELLADARNISWVAKHPFQQENIARWMKDFESEPK